jgi:hypothetical protein
MPGARGHHRSRVPGALRPSRSTTTGAPANAGGCGRGAQTAPGHRWPSSTPPSTTPGPTGPAPSPRAAALPGRAARARGELSRRSRRVVPPRAWHRGCFRPQRRLGRAALGGRAEPVAGAKTEAGPGPRQGGIAPVKRGLFAPRRCDSKPWAAPIVPNGGIGHPTSAGGNVTAASNGGRGVLSRSHFCRLSPAKQREGPAVAAPSAFRTVTT